MLGSFYSEQLNLKLLINLGAHIGHAKIDWNTNNNAYLAGLTKNNYIIFNINKTLYLFKRSLNFMHLIGYNNGKFVIYYPGDNSFYKLVMEGALDKEGLLPTKYPFIHSIVKPGFFSNWRVNYKKLVRQFFKVIFWNPYFFGGMTTKFLHRYINEAIFRTGISRSNLNSIRLSSDEWIKVMSNSLRVDKKIKKSHFRSFKPKLKVLKKALNNNNIKDNLIKKDKYSTYIHNFKSIAYTFAERYYLKFFDSSYVPLSFYTQYDLRPLNELNKLKCSFFIKSNADIDLLLVNLRCNYGYNTFTIRSNKSSGLLDVSYKAPFIKRESSINSTIDKSKYHYFISSFTDFVSSTVDNLNSTTIEVLNAYFHLKKNKSDNALRQFLKSGSLIQLVNWSKIIKRKQVALNLKPLVTQFINRKNVLHNLTQESKKILNRRNYFSKMRVSNKYLYSNFKKDMVASSNNLPNRHSSSKIDTNFNMIMSKYKLYQFNKRKSMINNRTRIESLKMLYYNIYSMLINIALRKDKYHNNNDNLTPYEQKFFRKFVKFILIFRYLKRLKLVPSAIILLNSDIHESQYTDFQNLNTAVIGLTDSNVQFTSLSYFIPTNDDNLILFLYYVKMLTHTYTLGRKHSILENLVPRLRNNLLRRHNYTSSFVYQYKDKLKKNKAHNLLPIGSKLDKLHIYRLEQRRKERETKQHLFLKWKLERQKHFKKKRVFQNTNKSGFKIKESSNLDSNNSNRKNTFMNSNNLYSII